MHIHFPAKNNLCHCNLAVAIKHYCRIVTHLGAGQFGTVHKGIWQSTRRTVDVAVKMLKTTTEGNEKVKFLQEAAINGQFKHPNVVKLLGVVTVGEPVSNACVTSKHRLYNSCVHVLPPK